MPGSYRENDVTYSSLADTRTNRSNESEPLTDHVNKTNTDDQPAQRFREQCSGVVSHAGYRRKSLGTVELNNIACQAADTPTSTLSAWCSSDAISNGLNVPGLAVSADVALQQSIVTAHPLSSICEEWPEEDTDVLACQEVTSHAIDVESDECSCAPSHLAPDERVAACSPFLVMQQTPIGKGTFGTVFKARLATDPSHRYPLAIKQMACPSAKTHKIVKHESDVMRAMHHAGLACIPRPYDLHWLQDQGKAFLVMERLHGSTLDEVIDSVFAKAPKNSPEVLSMLRNAVLRPCAVALIKAVHEMHTSGFCHADLKNSNAMVTHSEGTVTVRLIDMACSQQQKPGMQTGIALHGRHDVAYALQQAAFKAESGCEIRVVVIAMSLELVHLCTNHILMFYQAASHGKALREALEGHRTQRIASITTAAPAATCALSHEHREDQVCIAGQKRVRGGGTLHHMAPELVSNYIAKSAGLPSNSFDGMACDMWALGVMLIQLLTGSLPFWPKTGFDYHSMQALLNKWASKTSDQCSTALLQHLHDLSPSAAHITHLMLIPDVQARITAAQAMQHEFCYTQ